MKQIFSVNFPRTIGGCSLIAVYNTHTCGNYKNVLTPDGSIMNCLYVTLKGFGTVELTDKTCIHLGEKDFCIEKASRLSVIKSTCEDWHFVSLFFNPIGLNIPSSFQHLENMDLFAENQFVTKIIELMKTEKKEQIEYANALFTCHLLELRNALPVEHNRDQKIFNDIFLYINTNLENISKVSDLAKHFAYSEKHFRNIFEKYTKISPKQYINKKKLEKIASLLTTSSYSLAELSEMFGFYSPSHLISCFKKEFNVSPNVYRNKKNSHSLIL